MHAISLFKAIYFIWLSLVASLWVWLQAFHLSAWPLVLWIFFGSVSLLLIPPAALHYFFGSPLVHIFSQRQRRVQHYLFKNVYFYQQYMHMFYKIKFWDDGDGWNIATKNPWTTFTT